MEEPECLVQPDSICSKLDIAAALRESVSFGRFVTEPLEWGKWSSFSQNRYLEEAERHSTRGSVAEKKAYFEAHYKRVAAARKKAAQLLEQANAAAAAEHGAIDDDDAGCRGLGLAEAECSGSWRRSCADDGEAEIGAEMEDRLVWWDGESNSRLTWGGNDGTCTAANHSGIDTEVATQHGVLESAAYEIKPAVEPTEMPEETSDRCGERTGANTTGTSRTLPPPHCMDETETGHGTPRSGSELRLEEAPDVHHDSDISDEMRPKPLYESSPPPESDKTHNSLSGTEPGKPVPRYEASPLQENSNKQIPAWGKTESPPLIKRSTKPLPVPPSLSAMHPTPSSHGKENNPTPGSRNKSGKHTTDKPAALPVPINQSPQPKATKISTTPETTKAPPKPDRTWSPKVAFSCFRACQDLGNPRGTPRKASTRGTPKPQATSGVDDRTSISSAKTGQSTRKADGRWQSLIVSRGRSSSSTSRPDHSHNVSSLQSEDRAEKKKEYFQKLEEKLNAEKAERQLKAKEKAENELKLLRQSLSFKARPLPSFYERTKQPKQS